MNGFYNDYNRVVIETPEERKQKIKKQRKFFSRIFLSLLIYVLISQMASTGAYYVGAMILSAEEYQSFASSAVWSLIISCVAQYFIAFPIMMLTLIGTDKAKDKEKKSLPLSELFIMLLIGEALMYAGSLIGNIFNEFIGGITGKLPENSVATMISEIPDWLIFTAVVVIGPIVEELIFRKVLIDRLSVYGDKMAIIFSSVAFGLMHYNFYQFFYAALLGALLGYVYTSTRKIKYSIYIHMIVNFMGSFVALKVQEAMLDFYDGLTVLQLGEPVNLLALLVSGTVTFVYTNLQYGMIIGGIIALVHYIRKKKIHISLDKEIYLPDSEIAKNGIVNFGAISLIILCAIIMFIYIIFP